MLVNVDPCSETMFTALVNVVNMAVNEGVWMFTGRSFGESITYRPSVNVVNIVNIRRRGLHDLDPAAVAAPMREVHRDADAREVRAESPQLVAERARMLRPVWMT